MSLTHWLKKIVVRNGHECTSPPYKAWIRRSQPLIALRGNRPPFATFPSLSSSLNLPSVEREKKKENINGYRVPFLPNIVLFPHQINLMEATSASTATALRRLSLLSSHFRTHCFSTQVAAFNCSSSNGENQENGCVFCMIVRGEAPALKVYEDDVCLCILDANPLCFGHSLVIPKSHFPSLQETPPSLLACFHNMIVAAMSSKVPLISSAVMKATGCDSFNLLVNNGAAAGQVIYHTHIHIIPRKESDCLWTSESLSRCPLKSDEAQKLADGIRENLSFSNSIEDIKGQGSSLIVN